MIKENFINKKSQNIFAIEMLLPFFQLFAQYKFGISIGLCLLMVIVVWQFFKDSGKIQISLKFVPFLLFLGYVIVRDCFRALLGPDSMQAEINRILEYALSFFCVLVVCAKSFDEQKLYRVWKIAGVIFSIGILYHVVQIYILGHRIAPLCIIPGYILRSSDAVNQLRPSSFFAEPASFVTSMLPLLFLSLKHKEFKWAIFTTFSILLSTSTVGIVLSVILWAVTMIGQNVSMKRKIALLVVAIAVIWMFMNLNVFSYAQTKFVDVTEGESTFGSRVLVGFEILKRISFTDFIFGTNYSAVSSFVRDNLSEFNESPIVMHYWKQQRLFLNTFSRLIFQYGFIGFVFYVAPLIRYLMLQKYAAKVLVIVMLIAIFGQTMLLNSYYFAMIMILMLYENRNLMKKE